LAITFDGIVPTKSNIEHYITQQHIMRYVFASSYVKDKIVLDVACGAGYGSHFLAIEGAKKVYGVDIDKNALKIAKTYYSHPNVEYIRGDVLSLPFSDNFFDVIVSFETIEHILDTERYISEIKRVLKPDGIFICSTPNIKYTMHPEYHVHEFYPEEFWELLEKNFRKVEKYGQYISIFQRFKDIVGPKIDGIKSKIIGIISKTISLIPCIKIVYKRYYNYKSKNINKHFNPLKITELNIEYMVRNRVVPIDASNGILRIMVAVCKGKI